VRPVVPTRRHSARLRPGRAAAGTGHGRGLLAVDHRPDAALQVSGRPDRRTLAAADRAGRRPTGAGLGQRGSRGLLAVRRTPTDRRFCRVRGSAGHQVPALQATGSGGQGPGRAGQRLPRDVVPARAGVHLTSRLQRSARRLADQGEPAHPPHFAGPPGRPAGSGPLPDAGSAADRPAGLVEGIAAAAAGSLRPPGHLRLLGASAGRRPPHRGRRGPGPGPGDLRRRRGRPPCPQLGSPSDHHGPGPRGRGRSCPQDRGGQETGAGGDRGRGTVAGHLRPDLRRDRRRAEHG